MVDSTRSLSFVVSEDEAGERIDRLLIVHSKSSGRRATARLFAEGAVTVDGRRVRKGDIVRAGQQVLVALPKVPEARPIAELVPCIVTRDAVIVDKPWGMPSARLPTSTTPDAASALVARFPEMAGVGYGPREPGLVHRLDTYTSGLLLAARSERAFLKLKTLLAEGRLFKRYLALVQANGLSGEGIIDKPLRPHPRNKKKVAIDAAGRPSTTQFRVLERHGDLALLELRATAAYRHQIRVHLASIGHPLLGDALYGGAPSEHLSPKRHALHASYLACNEPDLEPFVAVAPLPEDMRRLLLAAD